MGKEEMAARIANLRWLFDELGAMTLRGYYYQGVVRGFWPQDGGFFKSKLQPAADKTRLDRALPLSAFLDRSRPTYALPTWTDLEDFSQNAARQGETP